jgi:hypothetical protein
MAEVASGSGTESQVVRIGGTDRYATAARVADWAEAEGLASLTSLAVVSGIDFPDAIGAAALAGRDGGALLMTGRDSLHPKAAEILGRAADAPGLPRVTVFGSEQAIAGHAMHQVYARVR